MLVHPQVCKVRNGVVLLENKQKIVDGLEAHPQAACHWVVAQPVDGLEVRRPRCDLGVGFVAQIKQSSAANEKLPSFVFEFFCSPQKSFKAPARGYLYWWSADAL